MLKTIKISIKLIKKSQKYLGIKLLCTILTTNLNTCFLVEVSDSTAILSYLIIN